MKIKPNDPRLPQKQIFNQIGFSDSTIKPYKNVIYMHSPFRIEPNTNNKRSKKVSNRNIDYNQHREHEHKQSQTILNDTKRPQMT